jgi:hypothetical protein
MNHLARVFSRKNLSMSSKASSFLCLQSWIAASDASELKSEDHSTKLQFALVILLSCVLKVPISGVWDIIRKVDFAFLPHVVKTSLLDGAAPHALGAMSKIDYKDGVSWTIRVLGIDESAHSLTWELLSVQDEHDAKAGASYSSRVDTIQLKRITRANWSFVEWSSDFSSDASLAAIQDCKHKKLEAFDDMDKFLRLKTRAK